MKTAGMVLGIIGGVVGMIVGIFSYGYTELVDAVGEVPNLLTQVDNVGRVRAAALLAPLLAVAGGAMAASWPRVGGAVMLLSGVGMYWGFGFGAFTMFPITMCLLGGVLSIAAGMAKLD